MRGGDGRLVGEDITCLNLSFQSSVLSYGEEATYSLPLVGISIIVDLALLRGRISLGVLDNDSGSAL